VNSTYIKIKKEYGVVLPSLVPWGSP